MTKREAIVFIENAKHQSELALKELSKIKSEAERKERIGEYYSNLENCKKEIESCDVAIAALKRLEKIEKAHGHSCRACILRAIRIRRK